MNKDYCYYLYFSVDVSSFNSVLGLPLPYLPETGEITIKGVSFYWKRMAFSVSTYSGTL